MKRKLLNGLLLATALVSVGTFQSCKDYEADFQNEWKQQNYTLEEEIALLKNRVGDLERIQQLCQQNCNAKFEELMKMLGFWNYQDRGTMTDVIKDLINRINELENRPGGGSEGLTADEIRDMVYRILIERGWGPGDDGKPQYIDIPGLQDKVLSLGRDIAMMQVQINELEKQIQWLKDQDENFENRISNIEEWIRNHPGCDCSQLTEDEIRALAREEAQNMLDAYKIIVNNELSSLRVYIDSQDTILRSLIDGINQTITQLDNRLTIAEQNAINALTQANQNKAALDALQILVNTIKGSVDVLESDVSDIKGDIADMKLKLEDIENTIKTLKDKVAEIEDQVDTNTFNINKALEQLKQTATKEELNKLVARVEANESAIQALQGDVLQLFNIYNRLNKLITGIIVQGVYNPLFGDFSLPIGVRNNMLVNYYGEYYGVTPLHFPSETTLSTHPMLTADEVTNLGPLVTETQITLNNGDFFMDGYMGKVYMTINPTNIMLDGVNLTLESSNGTESRVKLSNVQRSWENLTFGYTRSDIGNGFYEADAELPMTAGAINNTNLKLDENLKGAVKDILKDRTRANVFNLLKAVYGQINQDLPALGVKSTWKADDGMGEKEYGVVSEYGIAAVTFRPLSYNTYKNESIDIHFKKHGPIGDVKEYLDRWLKNENYHFSITANSNVTPDGVTFDFEISDINLVYNENNKLYATIDNIPIYDNDGNLIGKTGKVSIPVDPADMQNFLDDLSNQINVDLIRPMNQEMQEAFDEALKKLCDKVNVAINDQLKNLEIEINDQIDKILNDLKNDIAGKTQGLVDKFNKLLDAYNKAVDKLNDFMADPNHYLQVAMVYYAGNGDLHRLSNDPKDPTILKMNGGNGIQLIASSYTAEVAAPAYKKFVAISDAWQTNNPNNHLTPAEIQNLNTCVEGSVLGKVMTGRAKRFGIPTDQLKQGYTYQIVYTAVDYHGYTSTERYYIRLK